MGSHLTQTALELCKIIHEHTDIEGIYVHCHTGNTQYADVVARQCQSALNLLQDCGGGSTPRKSNNKHIKYEGNFGLQGGCNCCSHVFYDKLKHM